MKPKYFIRWAAVLSLGIIFLLLAEDAKPVYSCCPSGNGGGGGIIIPKPAPTPTPIPQVIPRPVRPPSNTGLEPLLPGIPNPPNPLVMDWEIWWIKNRLTYLPFKEPIVWEEKKTVGNNETMSVTQSPNKEVLKVMTDALKNDKNRLARAMAALALGKFRDKNAQPFLATSLKEDKDYYVRMVSSLSLGMLSDTSVINDLKGILSGDSYEINQSFAAFALGYVKDNASVEILKGLLDPQQKTGKETSCAALLALGNLQDKSLIPFLGGILNDPKRVTEVRAYAALALGRIRDAGAVPILRKALETKDANVKTSVALAFGLIKSPESKADLLALLPDPSASGTKNEPIEVQQFAVISLAQLGDKTVYDNILSLVTSKKSNYRLQGFATVALGILGEEKAADTLREMVVKKSPTARTAAVVALGLLKDKKSVPDLIKIVEKEEHADPVTYLYAIQALGMIGDASAAPALEKVYDRAQKEINVASSVYNNLTVALVMLGKKKEVLEILHKHLTDKDAPLEITLRALHGTAYVGDKSSVDVLMNFYKNEKNQDLRMYAMFALGFVLDREKVNPLYKIMADNDYYIWLSVLDHIFYCKPD